MKLSLSTRVAESFRDKREATVELEDLAENIPGESPESRGERPQRPVNPFRYDIEV